MNITQYINKKTGEENQIERFQKMLPKMKTKQEVRNLEMHLLRPKPLPEYKGNKAGSTPFQKRTLLFAFPNGSYIKRLSKFFTIRPHIQNNIYNINFLIELIRLLEKKRVVWDEDKKRFFMLTTKTKRRIKI